MPKQTGRSGKQAENKFQLRERYEGVAVVAEGIQEMPGTVIIHVAGYIDATNTNFFQRYTSRVVEAGFTRLAIDLHDVSFVSSTGVGAHVALLGNVRALGGTVVLVGTQSRVLEVFLLLGFASFFEFAETTEDAIAFLKSGAAPAVFPTNDVCPSCGKRVKLARSGRFRCPRCKVALAVDEAAGISL